MKKYEYILKSFINATGVLIYVSAIAFFGFNGEKIFGNKPNFLIPLFMLLLFIISASVTGLLVLGKPIQLYLNGLKKKHSYCYSQLCLGLFFFLSQSY